MLVRKRLSADPRKPGRPKKGEVVEKRVKIDVRVNPEFKRYFEEVARSIGKGAEQEERRALEDRVEVLWDAHEKAKSKP